MEHTNVLTRVLGYLLVYHQAFDNSKAAGRIANMGLEKLGAMSAGLGDKLNDNADKALDKAKAMDVSSIRRYGKFSVLEY